MAIALTQWTADYGLGAGPEPVTIPHAWRQDVPLDFEGPAVYRTRVSVPIGSVSIVFHGVCCEAEIRAEGELIGIHRGAWDSFAYSLSNYSGKEIDISVSVLRAGGQKHPIRQVASGFLPYLFAPFAGIYKSVELVHDHELKLELPRAQTRVRVYGSRIKVDGAHFYVRGVLHWGWYPELGHQNPPTETIRQEIQAIKQLGFNLIKFCLWVPPHEYLELMKQEGLLAWIELPLWLPSEDPGAIDALSNELTRVVRQYARHDNVIVWTVGCELSGSISMAAAGKIGAYVASLTECPLVKDSSGGSEIYGTGATEFGSFYDFHPYCEPYFYPQVLDSLLPGPRIDRPTLLGEFADADVHRDLAKIGDELPYWASTLPELNAKGVRWQYDLPNVVADSRFSNEPTASRHTQLMEASRSQALFMRKVAVETVRSRSAISGYVLTGLRDTPISSSGMFDDWGVARFSASECLGWNGATCLFLIPRRSPDWIHGGNRPGWRDDFNHFEGDIEWIVGCHSEVGQDGGLTWRIENERGETVAWGSSPIARRRFFRPQEGDSISVGSTLGSRPDVKAQEVGRVVWQAAKPGAYRLIVQLGDAANVWPVFVTPRQDFSDWKCLAGAAMAPEIGASGAKLLISIGEDQPGANVIVLTDLGTIPKPFWREAAYEFQNDEFWKLVPFANRWERLLAICSDHVIDAALIAGLTDAPVQVLMNRIDTRTYEEAPVVALSGNKLFTSLRPWGGLGSQPAGLKNNPAGVAFLSSVEAAGKELGLFGS